MRKNSAHDLNTRKQVILKAIVSDYVETAIPVGSENLVQRYELGVKPATVRNEMAEMEELGYLRQPHTSAGRVPSDFGYRYYVDRLMQSIPVNHSAQNHLRRLSENHGDLLQLLAETCKMLARMTRYVSLATTLNDHMITIRQIVLSPVAANRLLLVMLFSNGHVENQLFDAPEQTSLEDLSKASELLNAQVVGHQLKKIATSKENQPLAIEGAALQIYERGIKLIRKVSRELSRGRMVMAGEIHMLEQPEFQRDVERLEMLLKALEEESTLYRSLERSVSDQVTVIIGEENPIEPMQICSLIATRFYVGTQEAGTIGVIGPTRMRYDQTIPMVDLISRSLSEVLTHLMGNEN